MTPQPNRKGGRHVAPKVVNERRRMIIMIILAAVMALIAVICVLYRVWFVKPSLPPVSESNPPVSSVQPSGNPEGSEPPHYEAVQPMVSGERKSKDYYTFFVFGTDETSNLTDTMMVVSYDLTNQKATVMSIPRDTLINVKRAYKKMNGVYSWYGGDTVGTDALKSEVSKLLGFVPDYCVEIDWEIVGQMVEAIGGVYFEVPWDMWYKDPYQDLYIDLKAGYQKLNGDQAMQLVRWRKNMDPVTFKPKDEVSDIKRLEIQHSFLKSVLKQVLQLKNVTRIGELAQVFGENVVSDLTVKNLFWFGSQAIMGGLSVDNVKFCTMPWIAGSDYEGTSYVFPNWNKMLTLINEDLNPYVESVTMNQLDLMEVRVDGTLASSTGKLADPDMGVLPPEESEEPTSEPSAEPTATPGGTQTPASSPSPEVSRDPTAPLPEDEAPAGSEPPAASEKPQASEQHAASQSPEVERDPTAPLPEDYPPTVSEEPEDGEDTTYDEDDIIWMPI